jgi:hypothetical protein
MAEMYNCNVTAFVYFKKKNSLNPSPHQKVITRYIPQPHFQNFLKLGIGKHGTNSGGGAQTCLTRVGCVIRWAPTVI